MLLETHIRRAAAIALISAGLGGTGWAMSVPTQPAAPGLRIPVHDTHGSSVEEAAAATAVARHIVEDLIGEGKIAPKWNTAAVAEAKRVRPSIKSPYHLWVVRFDVARAVAGHGTELFVFVSETGAFLKYSYDGM